MQGKTERERRDESNRPCSKHLFTLTNQRKKTNEAHGRHDILEVVTKRYDI